MFPIDAPVPEFSLELSHELKTALERAQDAATGEHRIGQAFRAARIELAATQGDLETTRNRLGQAEAAQALAGGEPDKQSRRRLLTLRDDIEVHQAGIAGLESRLHDAAATIIQARQALAVAWRDWQNAQATTFTDAVYTPAVTAFLDALRLTAAVATALGNHRLHAITRGVYLPAANDPFRDMANPKRMNWREHPDAAELYHRLVAFRMEVTKHIEGFTEPEANDDAA
jgi:hypothetical protein